MGLTRTKLHQISFMVLAIRYIFFFFVPSACNDFVFTFTIQTGIELLDLQSFEYSVIHFVSTKIECSRLCSIDERCQAFYLDKITSPIDDTKGKRECTLLSEPVNRTRTSPGSGTYGFLDKVSVIEFDSFPNLKDGVLQSVEKGSNGIMAIYDCSSAHPNMTTISLLYTNQLIQWSSFNTSCFDTLCATTGLSNTLLRIDLDEESQHTDTSIYKLDVVCLHDDEMHSSDVVCARDTGVWSFPTGELKVGCVSTSCSRFSGERMVYAGKTAVTSSGTPCQAWTSQSPHEHSYEVPEYFIEDGNDLVKAENFCRDPDGYGALWCYRNVPGTRWESCDVPIC